MGVVGVMGGGDVVGVMGDVGADAVAVPAAEDGVVAAAVVMGS